MQFPIHNFQQYISETILRRGEAYYEDGQVVEVTLLGQGLYEAMVMGSEDYTVRVEVTNEIVHHYNCNCPYDLGPVCKHVVATLYHILEEELEEPIRDQSNTSNSPKKAPKAKNKTVKAELEELLEQVELKDLKRFVVQQALKNDALRHSFLCTFAHLNQEESQAYYQQQIRHLISLATRRDSRLAWQAVHNLADSIQSFINAIPLKIEQEQYQAALWMLIASIEEVLAALDDLPDHDGVLSANIYWAISILGDLGAAELPEAIRIAYLDYCITSYRQQKLVETGRHFELIHLALRVIQTPEEKKQLQQLLDAQTYTGWELSEMQNLKYELIKSFEGEQAAVEYLNQHLENKDLREKAIQIAYEQQNYDLVITYVKDGIKQDEKDSRPNSNVSNWYHWLLKIAEIRQDKAEIIQAARYLFLYNFNEDNTFYATLKQTIATEDWETFVKELIKDIKKRKHWYVYQQLAYVYIAEEQWQELLKFVQKTRSLETIKQYESYLTKEYNLELIRLYADEITDFLEKRMGRAYYQEACQYLKRMQKLGGTEKVQELIALFRSKYPKRRALMEELGRV